MNDSYKEVKSFDNKTNYRLKKIVNFGLIKHNFYPFKIGYISDLHLDDIIKDNLDESHIHNKIEKIIEVGSSEFTHILVAGDVAHNTKIIKVFFDLIRKFFPETKLIYVLGNHEFWPFKNHNLSIDQIVKEYKKICKKYDVILLHNELYIETLYSETCDYEPTILCYDEIMSLTKIKLKNVLKNSGLTILGGVGFSGYFHNVDIKTKLYNNVISLDKDTEETFNFEKLYNIIYESNFKNTIILTHMPKHYWSKKNYNPDFIYLSGHTHSNEYIYNEEIKLFADNQIGYDPINITFKFFEFSYKKDYFANYNDGIHEITIKDYILFYRFQGIHMKYSRKNTIIFMLKKQKKYMFVDQSINSKQYFFLGGGSPFRVKEAKDLNYFYDKMDIYSQNLKNLLKPYNERLKIISKEVKKFGGNGEIHGLIVDIDFYNHVYLNPFDLSLTYYHATSIINKYVYKNLFSLLFYQNKKLYHNYTKLIDSSFNYKNGLTTKSKGINPRRNFVLDTKIYKYSRIIRAVQYLDDSNIIRMWNQELFKAKDLNLKSIFNLKLLPEDELN